MKHVFVISVITALLSTGSLAQERIFRCGNEYTNNATEAQARGCKPLEGGNITVIQGTKPAPPAPARQASGSQGAGRVDSVEQRNRDADARAILEAELKKAEARQAELRKEYNNGEPDKLGPETRNYQKYLDRVAEMKANLDRTESDIAGIRRELGRMSPPASTSK
ncbi:MAG: hypothetical protein CVU30_14745 [Betaproteobacteria bacterium HGW-Betaproteobacteria-3]|jgi:hypothetical protein|nr:MAG: hypothetical protein CVU30_14745 [Betaproteobacteria bacterium HGW-Betaproteobacteria-3]